VFIHKSSLTVQFNFALFIASYEIVHTSSGQIQIAPLNFPTFLTKSVQENNIASQEKEIENADIIRTKADSKFI